MLVSFARFMCHLRRKRRLMAPRGFISHHIFRFFVYVSTIPISLTFLFFAPSEEAGIVVGEMNKKSSVSLFFKITPLMAFLMQLFLASRLSSYRTTLNQIFPGAHLCDAMVRMVHVYNASGCSGGKRRKQAEQLY